MSQLNGAWYFVYYEFNNHENWYPRYRVEIPLKADSKELALVEARLLWDERIKKGKYMALDGKNYPCFPLVKFEVSLESEV